MRLDMIITTQLSGFQDTFSLNFPIWMTTSRCIAGLVNSQADERKNSRRSLENYLV